MPFYTLGFEFLAQLFAFRDTPRLKRLGTLETQEGKSDSSASQLAQVRKHLALAKRIKHSVVGDE
jgi:hypothetical protein